MTTTAPSMAHTASMEITAATIAATSSNILLMENKDRCTGLECSICYKGINNKAYFACSAPCKKLFHVECIEKMITLTEENAYDEDEEDEVEHKCPYCRRSIDRDKYFLQIFARHLLSLSAGGYDVHEALVKVHEQFKDGMIDVDMDYTMYILRDVRRFKKPKQPKRAAFKIQRKGTTQRITMKTNLGGRRR